MISLTNLIESRVHLGHKVNDWNPSMWGYISGTEAERNVLNLVLTKKRLQQASNFLVRAGYQGKSILFIGTTEASSKVVKKKALKAKAHYVNYRWIGGTLTNHSTMLKSINKFRFSPKVGQKFSKKDKSMLLKKRRKLTKLFGGIKNMQDLPDIVVFVGQPGRSNPLQECKRLGITTIALVDTNSNLNFVDLAIPANADSIGSIEIILDTLSTSICFGQQIRTRNTQLEKLLSPSLLEQVKEDSISLDKLSISSKLREQLAEINITTLQQLLVPQEKDLSLKIKGVKYNVTRNLIRRSVASLKN